MSAFALDGPAEQTRRLEEFLRNYDQEASLPRDTTLRYTIAFADLNNDGIREAIVYLSGRNWCGSGGCPTLILEPEGTSYRVITDISITRAPIRILSHVTNGWHDISVWVQGGGIRPGYSAQLQFNGTTYPTNPSVLPARPLPPKAAGKTVISPSAKGTLLYR